MDARPRPRLRPRPPPAPRLLALVALGALALAGAPPRARAQDALGDVERVGRQLLGHDATGALYAWVREAHPAAFPALDAAGLAEALDGRVTPVAFRQALEARLAGLDAAAQARARAVADALVALLGRFPRAGRTAPLSAAEVKASGGDLAAVVERLRGGLYDAERHWLTGAWDAPSRGSVGVRFVPGELVWFNPHVSIPELGIKAGVPLTGAQKDALVRLLSIETVPGGGAVDGTAAFPAHVGRAVNPNSHVLTVLTDRGEVVGDLVTKGSGRNTTAITNDGSMETREGWLDAALSTNVHRLGVADYNALAVIVRADDPSKALLVRAPRSLLRHLDVDGLSDAELRRSLERHLREESLRLGRDVGLRDWLERELPGKTGEDAGRMGGLGIRHGGLVSYRDGGALRRDNAGLGETVDWDKVSVGPPTDAQKELYWEQVRRTLERLNALLPEGQRASAEQARVAFDAAYAAGKAAVAGKRLALDPELLKHVGDRDLANLVRGLVPGGEADARRPPRVDRDGALKLLTEANLLGVPPPVETAPAPTPGGGAPGEDVRLVDPKTLRFSQRSAGGNGRANPLRESLAAHGWNGPPVDVVETRLGLTSIDNTRIAVAQELGLPRVPVRVHQPNDPLPADQLGRFGAARTWGEALRHRTSRQRPPLPFEGTAERPRMPPKVTVTAAATAEGQPFAAPRPGAPGAPGAPRIPLETLELVLAQVRDAALARSLARAAEATGADRATLEAGARGLRALELEVVTSTTVLAELAPAAAGRGPRVRVSTGLLDAVAARADALVAAGRLGAGQGETFRRRVLALILGHEAAHAAGVRVEKVADLESLRVLEATALGAGRPPTPDELRATVRAFDRPTGGARVDAFFARLRDLVVHGFSRVSDLERAARGEQVDRLAAYRRADGTLDWKKVAADRGRAEALGLAHFGLALFLKELAVVAATGDRGRIEEFFDGLLTTDFYVQYGLFALGARAGEVAYVRHLERFVRPRFVNGILKTNLILATGLALPELVAGRFSGRAFAVSLGALGLSSAAVKAGVASLRWVVDLKQAREAGLLGRAASASRLARLGGWFYTAAELAVVLYLAEEVEERVHAALDARAAREAFARASRELLRAAADPAAEPDAVRRAAEAYHAAAGEYRNGLYGALAREEAAFAARLERVARAAKLAADERAAALARLREQPALRAALEARHGSLEAYAAHLVREDEARVARDVEAATAAYEAARARLLGEVYEGGRRGRPLLEGVEPLGWLAGGARPGAAGDPWGGRTDVFAAWGRRRAEAGLDAALGRVSGNRLEAYDDEAAVLAAAAAALPPGPRRAAAAAALAEVRALALRTRDADAALVRGGTGVATLAPTVGLRGALERGGDGR